jgi:hypothetical protein
MLRELKLLVKYLFFKEMTYSIKYNEQELFTLILYKKGLHIYIENELFEDGKFEYKKIIFYTNYFKNNNFKRWIISTIKTYLIYIKFYELNKLTFEELFGSFNVYTSCYRHMIVSNLKEFIKKYKLEDINELRFNFKVNSICNFKFNSISIEEEL